MIAGYPTQLLATKIRLPRSAPALIDRPRLLGLAASLPARQLAVIRAGAGFGKTTLAIAWAEWLQRQGDNVAWLALDPDDDEPTRFFLYLAHALRRVCPAGDGVIALISEISLVPLKTIVSALVNEIAALGDDIYLFLDDYHRITRPEIHQALAFLLRHAPGTFHLVLTTRQDPDLPLARLCAQDRLIDVDGAALRFDLAETRRFFELTRLDGLDPAALAALHKKTEGWPAVLRIVAATAQSAADGGRYISRLSGTHRPVGAYLVDMLDGLPAEMLDFMLRTAILDRLCAPLCQAVIDQSEADPATSQAMLLAIEARQLLLTALDPEGCWFRYHPLLAEHLRRRLTARDQAGVAVLHRRAAGWYAAQALWSDAVQHAMAAGDGDLALGWIGKCAMALVARGELFTLLNWQHRFPQAFSGAEIRVRLAIAWGLAHAMRLDETTALLAGIEAETAAGDGALAAIHDECQAVRALVVALQDDSRAALVGGAACLRRPGSAWTLNVASNVVRFGHWKAGDLEAFHATPWIADSDEDGRGYLFSSVYRLCLLGLVDMQQLRFTGARHHYREALRLAHQFGGPQSVAAGSPASLLARLDYEQGRFDAAAALVIDHFPIITETTALDCVLHAFFVLARIAAPGNPARAFALVEQAEAVAHRRGWSRLVAATQLERQRLYLADDRLAESRGCSRRLDQLAEDCPAPHRSAASEISLYAAMARARLAAAEDRLPEAGAIVEDLRRAADAAGDRLGALRCMTQLAILRLRAQQPAAALALIGEALETGAAAGLQRTFLDEGPDFGRLLRLFQEQPAPAGRSPALTAYVSRLLALCQAQDRPRITADPAPPGGLTPRECQILTLIGAGQSNKAIARSLGIAPETVKSHLKNIFGKLGVEKRAQAVVRAQLFGLVPTGYSEAPQGTLQGTLQDDPI